MLTIHKAEVVYRLGRLCQKYVDLKSEVDQLDVLYAGDGGVSFTLTPQDIAEKPEWDGLTKEDIDDAAYAAKATLTTGFSALALLASFTNAR